MPEISHMSLLMKNKNRSSTKMKENRWNNFSHEWVIYISFTLSYISINKKAANIINYHYVTSSLG